MVFSSIFFLYYFLPVFLAAYFLTPKRWRNATALAGSLFFFAWGAPRFIFVLVGSCLIDYFVSRRLAPGVLSKRASRLHLAAVLVLDIGLLAYFKYANFAVAQVRTLLELLNLGTVEWTEVVLPIGISFFTFQKISYLIDVYRGNVAPADSPVDYLLYIALFPQLLAGPIVRYHDVDLQIKHREESTALFLDGLWRFSIGLMKKVIVANTFARVADEVFDGYLITPVSPALAWAGVLAYAFQLYYDFSGYSDMAIGLGRMMGFRFLENFRFPYISGSVTEFWRRWHISLGRFMMEYLYIPLGGNRVGRFAVLRNLWIVFLVSGIWHGASWNFALWGAWHGAWISLERFIGRERMARIPRALGTPFTFLVVVLGWVLFRAPGTICALKYFRLLNPWSGIPTEGELLPVTALSAPLFWIVAGPAVFFAFAPAFFPALERILSDDGRDPAVPRSIASTFCRFIVSAVTIVVATCELCSTGFNPFIYFRF